MIIGVLRVELHLPNAHSLKDKRAVLKSLRDRLRAHFNVAVAQVDASEKWQRAAMGVTAVGDDRTYVEGQLQQVTEWLRAGRLAELIRVEHDCLTIDVPSSW